MLSPARRASLTSYASQLTLRAMGADLIKAMSLHRAPELIAELGGDPVSLFARVGLEPSTSDSATAFIPFSALTRLLGECSRRLGTPDFALRLADKQDLEILGPLAVAIRHSETIESALRNTIDNLHTYCPAVQTTLEVGPQDSVYSFYILLGDVAYRDEMNELALGVVMNKFRMIAGPRFTPASVTLPHAPRLPRGVYESHLRCPVECGGVAVSVRFPSAMLEKRVAHADSSAGALALRAIRMDQRETSFATVVATQVARLLSRGQADLESVSQILNLRPRTLQRRLAALDTSFVAVAESVRREMTVTLLANPDMSMTEIAHALGYSEQSVLSRSCQRWFSMSPSGKRKALFAAAARERIDSLGSDSFGSDSLGA